MFKNSFKAILFKLSYNLTIRKIAKRFFYYLPSLKRKLIQIRDSSPLPKVAPKISYDSKILDDIKKEVEKKRNMVHDNLS